jgi:hypothetical protein
VRRWQPVGSAQRDRGSPSARGTRGAGRKRLTGHRPTSRRRTGRVTLTRPRHVNERSDNRQRRTRRSKRYQRCTDRHHRDRGSYRDWGSCRHRHSSRHRRRKRNQWSTNRNHRNRPGRNQRNARHVSERSASGAYAGGYWSACACRSSCACRSAGCRRCCLAPPSHRCMRCRRFSTEGWPPHLGSTLSRPRTTQRCQLL